MTSSNDSHLSLLDSRLERIEEDFNSLRRWTLYLSVLNVIFLFIILLLVVIA